MPNWKDYFTHKNGKLYWKNSKGSVTAGKEAGTNHGDGYKTIRIDGKAYYAHRIVKEMTTGKKPNGFVDHKDRNRSNNKPANLKTTSRSTNNKNRRSWKRSK